MTILASTFLVCIWTAMLVAMALICLKVLKLSFLAFLMIATTVARSMGLKLISWYLFLRKTRVRAE